MDEFLASLYTLMFVFLLVRLPLFVFAFSYRRVTKRITAVSFIMSVFPPIRSIRMEKRISHQKDVIFGNFFLLKLVLLRFDSR
jgi:uncharacterized membrane-anchored protein YitT (DUF2179 family)